ncbi:hypothetical protein [Bradyrhizobium oligotrophicum]|uniref:hypothetical protein n=1 Tax=Bradyrhizobium oligotrophicum TaxID=44255 RepID=UPI003EB8FC15
MDHDVLCARSIIVVMRHLIECPPALLREARRFIDLNRDVLLVQWEILDRYRGAAASTALDRGMRGNMTKFLLFVIVVTLLFGTGAGIFVFSAPIWLGIPLVIVFAVVGLMQRPRTQPLPRPIFRDKADELDWANREGRWAPPPRQPYVPPPDPFAENRKAYKKLEHMMVPQYWCNCRYCSVAYKRTPTDEDPA